MARTKQFTSRQRARACSPSSRVKTGTHLRSDKSAQLCLSDGIRDTRRMSKESAELKRRLENLPLVVYSMIHDLVFLLPEDKRPRTQPSVVSRTTRGVIVPPPRFSEQVVIINEQYKPPKYLQLNSTTRNENAERYYATTIFIAQSGLARTFISNIGMRHRFMVKDLRLAGPDLITGSLQISRFGEEEAYTTSCLMPEAQYPIAEVFEKVGKDMVFW